MNKITTTLLLLLLHVTLFAQVEKRSCGAVDHQHHLEQAYPEVIAKRAQIESQTQAYIANPSKKHRTIVTIPVVVHVVYNTGSQNISNAQIESQINVLNADFRKLNADFFNTPAAFQSVAADCEFQFVLAKRAPNGDSTNGITRTQTLVTSFTYNDNVKNPATGGVSAWPASDYLNIWVCKLSSGLLGYAQFPGGPAATDGVVVSYRAFGTMGTALAPFNKGRSATHEIGHWMNLFHIWGDDGGSCNGTDLVNDTPNQGAENYGIPTYPKISCNNTPTGDMFMNYMDYTDDAGMTMFSTGQKDRMNALFQTGGARASLLNSLGGVYPAPGISCGIPSNIDTSSITSTSVTLSWDAVVSASSYTIQMRPLGSNTWTTYTSSVTTYIINGLNSSTSYEYQLQATCSNGPGSFSSLYTFTTSTAAPQTCGIPSTLTSNNINSTSAILSWQAVLDATYYTIYVRELGIPNWDSFISVTNIISIPNLIPVTGYEFKIKSTCAFGESELSISGYFNTLATPPPTCTNNYEPNDTRQTGTLIDKNTIISSMLDTDTDNDYFTFSTNATQPKFKITLSNMPADYDMKVYNNAGVQILASQNGRLQNEEVISNNTTVAGTYSVRVLGYNGKFDPTSCYLLYVETSSSDFKSDITPLTDDGEKPQILYYPNPTSSKLTAEIYATGNKDMHCNIYNAMGQIVFAKDFVASKGLNNIEFNVANYPNGIYLMELIDSEEKKIEKFFVQH